MLSMMKDMADKTNLCTSDPRYQEMLSFLKVNSRRDMKERMEEDSDAIREEVSIDRDSFLHMAGKSNLTRSEPRYEEMLSIMKEIAGKAMKQKMKT